MTAQSSVLGQSWRLIERANLCRWRSGREKTIFSRIIGASTTVGSTKTATNVHTIHIGTNIGLLLGRLVLGSRRAGGLLVRVKNRRGALVVVHRGHPRVELGHALLDDESTTPIATDVRDVWARVAGAAGHDQGHRDNDGSAKEHEPYHIGLTFPAQGYVRSEARNTQSALTQEAR